jgi:hypothetical protein
MLVKSPLKKKKTKKNTRKSSTSQKKKTRKNGRSSGSNNYGRRKKKRKTKLSLPKIAPWKVILSIVVAGLLGVAYLSHVFATQELLAEVQQLEQEYNQAQRARDRYRLEYDRMIGPAEISEKAKGLGFINGGPAEKVIEVEGQ